MKIRKEETTGRRTEGKKRRKSKLLSSRNQRFLLADDLPNRIGLRKFPSPYATERGKLTQILHLLEKLSMNVFKKGSRGYLHAYLSSPLL